MTTCAEIPLKRTYSIACQTWSVETIPGMRCTWRYPKGAARIPRMGAWGKRAVRESYCCAKHPRDRRKPPRLRCYRDEADAKRAYERWYRQRPGDVGIGSDLGAFVAGRPKD